MSGSALLEPPPPAAAARPAVALPDLLLVRLLAARQSLAPAELRADLAVFYRRPPTADQLGEALAALRAEGFVTPRGQRATGAGRARALQFLGVGALPPRANWGTVKAKYLLPRALGRPTAPAGGKRLAALLLKRRLGLPAGTGDSLRAVFEAIACRQLGYPDHATLRTLVPVLLGKAIGGEPVGQDAETVVPRVMLGARRGGVAGLRDAAFAGWADGGAGGPAPGPAEVDEPFDLEAFANTVRAAARTCPTGWFGGNKVFISHVWDQLRDEPRFAPLGPDGFKDRLVDANRAGLLTLSRADLVQLMDPADVRASETTYLTAVFHFVLAERG